MDEYTIKCLRQAGWYQGRYVNISSYIEAIQLDGYAVFPQVEAFLHEFGGLEVIHKHRSGEGTDNFIINPLVAIKNTYIDRIRSYEVRVGKKMVVVGEAFSGHMTLCASNDMQFFAGYDDTLIIVGKYADELFNNLCTGGRVVYIQ